jgi:ribosome maturation factor RimP
MSLAVLLFLYITVNIKNSKFSSGVNFREWAFPLFCFMVKTTMMDETAIQEKVRELAANVAEDEGVELVDVAVLGPGSKKFVRITIDRDGGISISACERVSRSLETLLDVEDIFTASYTLEVSSPGLDRPLVKMQDFERSVGKLVKIVTKEKIGSDTCFVGRIIDTGENWIRLRFEQKPVKGRPVKKRTADDQGDVFIPFDRLSRARLEIEQ